MHPSIFTAALLLGTASPLFAQFRDECRHEAQRTATVAAADARNILVQAGAGSLKIEGKASLDRVQIRGRACASSAGLLEDLQIRADRSGSDVRVESVRREDNNEWSFTGNRYA